MDKFSSTFDRLHIELGSRFLKSSRIKTRVHKARFNALSVADGATHAPEDGVESSVSSLLILLHTC
jgi:hypothetical protein